MHAAAVIPSTAIGILGLALGVGNPRRSIRRYWESKQISRALAWATVLSGLANEVAAIGAISIGIRAWAPGNQADIWSLVSGICLFAWLMLVFVAETVQSRSH